MKFLIDKHEKYVLLKPLDIESLDSETAPKLKSELILINSEGINNIIIDLSNVRTVDESGASALLSANRICKSNEGTFVLSGVHSDIKQLLELSTTDKYINLVPTVTEAI